MYKSVSLNYIYKKLSLRIFFILMLFCCYVSAAAQYSSDTVLNYSLSFRGLTAEDITIPVNFDKDKSPVNDSKLLLPAVQELMVNPLKSSAFQDSLVIFLKTDFISAVKKLYNLKNQFPVSPLIKYKIPTDDPSAVGNSILSFVKEKIAGYKNILSLFTANELSYLNENLLSLISESENDDGNNTDIFKFNRARDSSIAVSRRTLDILNKKEVTEKVNAMLSDAGFCFDFYESLNESSFDSYETEHISNKYAEGDFYFYYDRDGIRIAIGGKGKNIYKGRFDFIIDTGGDDVYDLLKSDKENKSFADSRFSCIMDLSGNDFYKSENNYSLAGSVFSSSFIFDRKGDDVYKGKNVSLGSAICGLGILFDENGNDIYQADQFSVGAASFGVGLLYDKNGNDFYIANSYSQGFGMTEGAGAIIDFKGNDSYLIDARSLDIGRYEDHYVSMSQGFGLGLRPYYAGGIGIIVEGEGNDFYNTDIFGQGGGYWYSLGCISDFNGNDKYNSYQYAQGSGIHLAVGLLKDYNGWDFYSSNGVSQGCGHDFGFGLLEDVNGNDNYSCYSLSQGAGNANGIGIFIDKSGRDGYLNKEPANTRGYGNPRREFGSLGIFADESGTDFYSVSGMDSSVSNSSVWGTMNDFYPADFSSLPSGTNYKVPLDSMKSYTQEEYFIMAETIEPRFSLWQEYGFRKLVEDSLKTPEFIMKYLDTEDHRAGLVLRNLAFRIGFSLGNYFVDKFGYYFKNTKALPYFNENQLAFICYLFGETGNPIGKEELLKLTEDERIRIKSASVNALGKLKLDSADSKFREKVSERLRELAAEKSSYKMFNKDIAFAFGSYKSESNIPALIEMMSNGYFGVRFTAADDLKKYGDTYYTYLNDNLIENISQNKIWFQSFINSLLNLSDDNFKKIFSVLLTLNISGDEIIRLNYADLLKQKSEASQSADFKSYARNIIDSLQSGSLQKLR